MKNFDKREKISEKRSVAGRAGMQARWASDNKAITNDNKRITKGKQTYNNHNKGKEKKKNNTVTPNGDFSPGGKYENMVF